MPQVNRKQMILNSVMNSLSAEEYYNITTKTIAVQSDVTEAALYKHFKGKLAIIKAVYEFIELSVTDKIMEIRNRPITANEKFEILFRFLVLFVEQNTGFARILTREALTIQEKEIIDSVDNLYNNIKKEFLSYGLSDQQADFVIITLQGVYCDFIRTRFKILPSSNLDKLLLSVYKSLS